MIRYLLQLILIILLLPGTGSGASGPARRKTKIPVIYCTDLFHPHDDPDDHFDLASLYAIPELEIKAVILDQGAKQETKPGRIAVEQLNHLTSRKVPWAIGLSRELTRPSDAGLDEPPRYQAGVELILSVLEKSPSPVTLITVGSLRDVAAALNRKPALFAEKVARLFVFIGDAQGAFREYNVTLDPHAYVRVMNSGLPVYWVPCFDGGIWKNEAGHASYWQARHAELLADVSPPVMNYLIFALLRQPPDDPIGFLHESRPDSEKLKVLADQRNLWCSAVFPFVADRKYVLREGRCLSVAERNLRKGDQPAAIFTFQPVKVKVDGKGVETCGDVAGAREVNRFQILDRSNYAPAMTSVTRELLKELSNREPPKKTKVGGRR